MKTYLLQGGDGGRTSLRREQNDAQLTELCGVPVAPGPCVALRLADTIAEPVWQCRRLTAGAADWRLTLAATDTGLEVDSRWTLCQASGILRRADRLRNTGGKAVVVTRCQARIVFPAGRYEVYAQDSAWCNENQGRWLPLHTGVLKLGCQPGRTSQGGTPYACLREMRTGAALAFHVLPCGNWCVRFTLPSVGGGLHHVIVELGLADDTLRLALAPGDEVALPEILFQPLPHGEPHLGAPALHRYLLANVFCKERRTAPVVYNTWFDQFEILDVPRLRQQLAAARTAGCELFVIDAGWYGAGSSNWWAQAGDWREKTGAAFAGKMRAFADEVRAAGLGFGIWMEPERCGPEAPLRREHPDWFVPCGVSARFDLEVPAAYAWLRDEIGRLIKTYDLAWIKLDYNFEMERDAAGAELSRYHACWYSLLDEVRAAHPQTFFEGCASGAMRLDIESLTHFDNFFLSDSVEPVDMLRISQGAYLRLPPGRIGRWAVLRSAGQAVPRYGKRVADSPVAILVAGGAGWDGSALVDLDFALFNALPGMLGFSGDFAGLPPEVLARIHDVVGFYRTWRPYLARSVAHLLTPPERLEARSGWIAFQYHAEEADRSLLCVYRLGICGDMPRWRLHGLRAEREYRVQRGVGRESETVVMRGADLLDPGLAADWPGGGARANAAAVWSIVPAPRRRGARLPEPESRA